MKKRLYYALIVSVILALLIISWWLMFSLKRTQASNSPRSGLPTRAINSSLSDSGNSTSTATTSNTVADISNQQSIPAFAKERVEKTVAALNRANSRLLDMHGKVVDQYDQPVVGATIRGSILLYDGLERTKEDLRYTETDNRGLFSFEGIHGVTLGIWPQKEGYTYDLKLTSRRQGNYRGDYENPDVFVMWKLKGAEPMIHAKISTGIPCDGTTVNFDLLTGRKATNSNGLSVTLNRNPVNIDRSKPYDWRLTIGVASGGLVEIADPYPNEAPTGGYQTAITIDMPVGAADWSTTVNRSYYFKSGQNYGRITINTTTNFQPPPTVFRADIYINPSGSRNLEFARAKEIKVK